MYDELDLPNDRLIIEKHPLGLVTFCLKWLFFISLYIYIMFVADKYPSDGSLLMKSVGLLVFIFILISVGVTWFQTKYFVKNDNLYTKDIILLKKFQLVEDSEVFIHQNIFQKIFKYGNIQFSANNTKITIYDVKSPKNTVKSISDFITSTKTSFHKDKKNIVKKSSTTLNENIEDKNGNIVYSTVVGNNSYGSDNKKDEKNIISANDSPDNISVTKQKSNDNAIVVGVGKVADVPETIEKRLANKQQFKRIKL
jgi:hypothetical protein